MNVYTRYELAGAEAAESPEPRLLLEGSWPQCGTGISAPLLAVDELIDARFGWIDKAAAELAERIAGCPLVGASANDTLSNNTPGNPAAPVTFAWLNVLRLRYLLVKLLRVVATFELQDPRSGGSVRLHAETGRDDVYVELLRSVCRHHGLELLTESYRNTAARTPDKAPENGAVRQSAGVLANWLDRLRGTAPGAPHVVLVGDQAVLGSVCAESLRRGLRTWWLYDRFCASAWKRWNAAGAGQLNLNSTRGYREGLELHAPTAPWCAGGVDLTSAVQRWLREQAAATSGPGEATTAARQTRLIEQIDRQFERVRPTHVVLDEDATPLARAAIAVARRHGATTSVVQHGAPVVRFGFAPSIAERAFVWGESSRQRLIDWGLAPESVHVTGSPKHDRRSHRAVVATAAQRRREILLLATVPPRDDRPDAVTFHLTTATYTEMLRSACAAVAGLKTHEGDGYELVIRPHPRDARASLIDEVAAGTAGLRYRIERDVPLDEAVAAAAVVLSCASSAGVEAAWLGAPVVQLMPAGSADALVAHEWGMLGTARSLAQLRPLLDEALSTAGNSETVSSGAAERDRVFAVGAEPAACRIVDLLANATSKNRGGGRTFRFDTAHRGVPRRHMRRRRDGRDERRAA
ncbi:MAG: UDP-N-acetylglucosamine 2-epimerase [Pirellulales bacterium]